MLTFLSKWKWVVEEVDEIEWVWFIGLRERGGCFELPIWLAGEKHEVYLMMGFGNYAGFFFFFRGYENEEMEYDVPLLFSGSSLNALLR